MDYHRALLVLTTNDKQDARNSEGQLEQILQKAFALIPDDVWADICRDSEGESNLRWRYLRAILFTLRGIRTTDLATSDTFLSVDQFRRVKAALEIAIAIGIVPCLLLGVDVSVRKLCPRTAELPQQDLSDFQKYERLSFTVHMIMECFEEIAMRPAVLSRLGPLLSALLQLSAAPLMKPSQETDITNAKNSSEASFEMSRVVYERLMNEQKEFRVRLISLIDRCPQSVVIKELMVILGVQGAPNWLRRETRRHLIERITRPSGVAALVLATCDGALDLGAHWDKLDTVTKLVAAPHGSDPNEYYDAVCSQLCDLLKSTNIEHSSTLANWFINALYERDASVCTEKIINVIAAPLLISADKTETSDVLKTEKDVTVCIEALSNCFIATGANSKCLPSKALAVVANPLFYLYHKARRSVASLRNNVIQLLLLLLTDETLREDLFAALLDDDSIKDKRSFGEKLSFRIGPNGGFEITGQKEFLELEELGDSLFNLLHSNKDLSYSLFLYLLRSLSCLKKIFHGDKQNCPETNQDEVHHIERRLITTKLLSLLAETASVQEALINNPEHILSFVQSLVKEKTQQLRKDADEVDNDIEVLYISLMLIKVILSDGRKPRNWKPFDELAASLNEAHDLKLQPDLLTLAQEVSTLIKTRGSSTRQENKCQDDQEMTEFESALKDLTDPLLPVRAHGLMALTKLIERSDHEAVANKEIILCFFQENLKHEDSFLYLAAINGLVVLATSFPQKVIEILVQEFIDMPHCNTDSTTSPETRAKIGEVLVKVTKALGDKAPSYKNVLINGFLCGTRDPDPLVRASSLSCLGELCKVLGFRLGNIMTEILLCIGNIIRTDTIPECRRAGVLAATLLLRGLGKAALTNLGNDLVPLYRGLLFLRDHDDDHVLRLHAQLALEEFDDIVRNFLFSKGKLETNTFVLEPPV